MKHDELVLSGWIMPPARQKGSPTTGMKRAHSPIFRENSPPCQPTHPPQQDNPYP
ncbi:hypothetical protein SACS_1540 [Parasaccharibacter apium]|uniref:Uncharacterized protein n=1 Tax=Parasaccharibacter apium TaxID=1510841 RepID=A0A7U7G701_9PROT|nr:hypothetical protein SACS_1540 [Parasaccharibacter apium]